MRKDSGEKLSYSTPLYTRCASVTISGFQSILTVVLLSRDLCHVWGENCRHQRPETVHDLNGWMDRYEKRERGREIEKGRKRKRVRGRRGARYPEKGVFKGRKRIG